jgi:hypothetical protein
MVPLPEGPPTWMHCPGIRRDGHCVMLARHLSKVATGHATVKWPLPPEGIR